MNEKTTEKTVKLRSRKFGWGYNTTLTQTKTGLAVFKPESPSYEGTLRQCRQQRVADRTYRSLGGACVSTAWFYEGRRIVSTQGSVCWYVDPDTSNDKECQDGWRDGLDFDVYNPPREITIRVVP